MFTSTIIDKSSLILHHVFASDQHVGDWDMSKVTEMHRMFYFATFFHYGLCWDLHHPNVRTTLVAEIIKSS